MKKELYSCMKMLEALRKSCISTFNSGSFGACFQLRDQYRNIHEVLKNYLSSEEIKNIPKLDSRTIFNERDERAVILSTSSVCDVSIAYLRSLDMSLDKELAQKEYKLKQKEEEINLLEKELQSERNILKKAFKAVSQIPEVRRSEAVAKIKEEHRNIEKYTRKKKEKE